jgi:hypothetical protein
MEEARGFYRVELPIPPRTEGRPADAKLLMALRPLWPLLRVGQFALPAGSAARTRALRRTFPQAFAAINRQDFALVNSYYRRDAEMRADPEAVKQLGLEKVYRGRRLLEQLTEDWNEAFSEWRWEMPLLLDGGNRWVVLGHIVTVGAVSDIEVSRRIAAATLVRHGQIARQDLFWEWEDALAVYELPPPEEIPWAKGQGPG